MAAESLSRAGFRILLLASLLVPLSLLWDFSWESTIGVDRFWSPPHTLTFAAMGLALVGALSMMGRAGDGLAPGPGRGGIRLGPVRGPLGAWLVLWSVLAFAVAVLFDRWWQGAYGLQAGIWHPPQLLKAVAFFAMIGGVWLVAAAARPGSDWMPVTGGCALALLALVTLTASYPNEQHAAGFYRTAGAVYPLVLAALARAGRTRWPASRAALVYTLLMAAMVWVLPRFAARPLTGPIYNALDHLMPPPFPLLLIAPALVMDVLLRRVPWPKGRGMDWLQALALGAGFVLCFLCAQWLFARFLLTPAADNWFFAGGGRHWPFFLKISPPARVQFWTAPEEAMTAGRLLVAAGWAVLSVRVGLWLGAWLARVRR